MAITANASLDFIKLPVAEKSNFGKHVYNSIGAKTAQLPDLPVPLTTLLATITSLNEAQLAALTGEKSAAEKLKATEKLWNTQFKKTANYVSMVADGDVQLIIDCGFKATKVNRQKQAVPNVVSGLAVGVEMAKGTCSVWCNAEDMAKGYVYIAAPENVNTTIKGDTLVIDVNGVQVFVKTQTQSRTQFINLPSGQKQCISMYAFNSSGCASLTEKQSVIPQ